MMQWFVCLVRGHDWHTRFEKELRRNRTICRRCSGEKTSLFDTDLNPSFFG